MNGNSSKVIFWAVVLFTASCGAFALLISVLPLFIEQNATSPFLEPMFNTLSYLFSTGVGVVFGMMGGIKLES